MSKQIRVLPGILHQSPNWSVLLEETKAEYWASKELTKAEKRFLDDLKILPEEDWEPVACSDQHYLQRFRSECSICLA